MPVWGSQSCESGELAKGSNTPVTEKSEEEVGVPPSADFAVTLFLDPSPLIILR